MYRHSTFFCEVFFFLFSLAEKLFYVCKPRFQKNTKSDIDNRTLNKTTTTPLTEHVHVLSKVQMT